MTSIDDVTIEITPQVLLKAYACGIFPMAESAEDNALYWIEPERRGILPLHRAHVPRRLARSIRRYFGLRRLRLLALGLALRFAFRARRLRFGFLLVRFLLVCHFLLLPFSRFRFVTATGS